MSNPEEYKQLAVDNGYSYLPEPFLGAVGKELATIMGLHAEITRVMSESNRLYAEFDLEHSFSGMPLAHGWEKVSKCRLALDRSEECKLAIKSRRQEITNLVRAAHAFKRAEQAVRIVD